MKVWIVPFVLLPLTIFAQRVTEPYPYQESADNIVAYFLGREMFQHYVQLDATKTKSSASSTSFQYNFLHPAFSGYPFIISFTVDSLGQFIPGEDTYGIIRVDPLRHDSAWVSAKHAIDICRKHAHHLKKRSLRLTWNSTSTSYDIFRKTSNYRDIVPGEMQWEIDGVVEFRGDRYRGTFKVDVITGTLAKHFAIPWD